MLDWLLAPIDSGRAHLLGADAGLSALAWHGRLMVLAWAILAPVAVLWARFGKILPGQLWPQELDNQIWWRSHWIMQCLTLLCSAAALALVGFGRGAPLADAAPHGPLGWSVLTLLLVQALSGLFRGSKGGPTEPAPDGSLRGDHYDMSRWRLGFELLHRSCGYAALVLSCAAISSGLWHANAPRWMWAALALWWAGLGLAFVVLQRRGFAVETYQAIWGPDPRHPGNRNPPRGWAVRRPGNALNQKED